MPRVPVLTGGVQLLAWKTDAYYPFACADFGRLTMGSDILLTTTPSSGPYRTRMPAGIHEWEIELGMVTVLRDLVNTFWFSWETLLLSVRQTRIQVKWKIRDRAGYEKYAIGYVYVQNTDILFNMNEPFSSSNIKLVGDGGLDFSSLITPNNPRNVKSQTRVDNDRRRKRNTNRCQAYW